MINYYQLTLCLLTAFLIPNFTQATSALETTTSYKNQRGSQLVLTFHEGDVENTGRVSGTFATAVGNCKEDMNVALPISGYYNGNALTITVNFPHCHQAVAMSGNINRDKSELYTLWLDTRSVEDPRGSNWNSNIIGFDSYQKTS